MTHVFLVHHVHESDGREEVKFIGAYSSEDRAQAAAARLSRQPGFVDHPAGFQIERHELDHDGWTDGFVVAVVIEVPLRDTEATVGMNATRLASGSYQLWPEHWASASTEGWAFKPNQIVRCEVRGFPDGTERLVAVELVSR